MKNFRITESKIKKAYSDLQQLGISARITVRSDNNMLLDYPVFDDLILREMTEDDCLFMEDRVNAVIRIQSIHINQFSSSGKELPCVDKRMKSVIGGSVTYFWQDHVNAILLRGEGAYCFGKTLREAARCCEMLDRSVRAYINSLLQ